MSVSLNVFNAPYGLDGTDSRRIVHGNVVFTGSYVTGGLLPTWNPLVDKSGQNVLLDAITTGTVFNVTQVGVASNVAYVVAANTLKLGQSVSFNSLTGSASVLNGQTLPINTLSSSLLTVNYTTPNFSNVATSGSAVLVIGPDSLAVTSDAGSGYTYGYNKANATIQVFSGNIEIANGSNITANVGVDVISFEASYVKQ